MTKHLSRWLARVLLCGVVFGVPASADEQHLAEQLATCAAYFFNASHARPMAEYEALYSAGERAMNRAHGLVEHAQLEHLMASASERMTALSGADWRNFDRVRLRHDDVCTALMAQP